MSELRYNQATREWVVVAPERARRPEDFHLIGRPLTTDRPAFRDDCPFCPGQEENTPGETLRYDGPEGQWIVRAFPNRFPALHPEPGALEQGDLFHRRRKGHGLHDVIAESPLHNVTLALQPLAEVELVLRAWRQRYQKMAAHKGVEHVVVFKNHSVSAGTSLEHPHSQVVALPVIPSSVRTRMDVGFRYFQKQNRCVFCDMLAAELKDRARIVTENEHYVAFVPFAAYSPYSIWLLPRVHNHCFGLLPEEHLPSLAAILQDLLKRLYCALRDPDYNLVVRSAAPAGPGTHFFHWYLALVPRLSKLAGFELGTGMFINASSPEIDAQVLRDATEPTRVTTAGT